MTIYRWGWTAGTQAEAEYENADHERCLRDRAARDASTPTLTQIRAKLPATLAKAVPDRKHNARLRKGMAHAYCIVKPAAGRMWTREELATVAAALGDDLDYTVDAFGFGMRYIKRGRGGAI